MLEAVLPEFLKDRVNTGVPGHILSFDPDTQTAEVQIGLMGERITGQQYVPSPLLRVVVQFPGGSGGTVEFKLSRGDEGYIHFSQECIDSWIDQGGVAAKPEVRRFSKDDAWFVPGGHSIPNALPNFVNEGIRIRNQAGTSWVWIRDNGVIEIDGVGLRVKCPTTFEGDVDTMAALRNFLKDVGYLHSHIGVQPGPGTTGPVV